MDASLGGFLMARRAALSPGDVDLVTAGSRRVNGLRREEVAVLAGVSADYYTRLEQGRESHPSAAVLDALAGALKLDADSRAHLYRLSGASPALEDFSASSSVSRELQQLLDAQQTPALVLTQTLDVVARNEHARWLHSGFTIDDNSARMAFLDPRGREFYLPWAHAAESVVAGLRLAAGQTPEDPCLGSLIEELTSADADFRGLWAKQRVRAKTNEVKRFCHPEAGEIAYSYQSFDVRAVPGQQLVIFGELR